MNHELRSRQLQGPEIGMVGVERLRGMQDQLAEEEQSQQCDEEKRQPAPRSGSNRSIFSDFRHAITFASRACGQWSGGAIYGTTNRSRSQEAGVRSQEAGVRSQESEVRSQSLTLVSAPDF